MVTLRGAGGKGCGATRCPPRCRRRGVAAGLGDAEAVIQASAAAARSVAERERAVPRILDRHRHAAKNVTALDAHDQFDVAELLLLLGHAIAATGADCRDDEEEERSISHSVFDASPARQDASYRAAAKPSGCGIYLFR